MKIIKIFLTFLFCILASSKIIFAQTNIWEKRLTFSSPKVRDSTFKGKIIKEDNLGNYYTYFFTDSFVSGVCKLDINGNYIWENLSAPMIVNSTKVERATYITFMDLEDSNQCKLTGQLWQYKWSFARNQGDLYQRVLDNNGKIKYHYYDTTVSFISFAANPFYDKVQNGLICAYENSEYLELIRIDSNNQQVWKKKIKDPKYYHDDPRIKRAKNGDYVVYVSLVFPGYSPTGITKLIRTDNLGNTKWTKYIYRKDSASVTEDLILTKNDEIVTLSYIVFLNKEGQKSVMTQIVKVDSNGNKIWDKLYSTDKNLTWGKCIAETKEGGFVIGGEVGDEWSSNFNLRDLYLLRVDKFGNQIWEKHYGSSIEEDIINDIEITKDNDIVVTGSWGRDLYIAKFKDDILSIKDGFVKNNFYIISPNPASNYFTINSGGQGAQYRIVNGLGEFLCSGVLSFNQTKISIENFSSGVYFVTVKTGNNVFTEKLVVVKE